MGYGQAMSIRVVCFDLGGVLVRICRSMDEVVARVGLPPPERQSWLHPNLLARRTDAVRRYHRGELTCEDYYAELAEASAGHYSHDDMRRVHRSWIWGEYSGVAELVSQLNQREGLVTACLSNTAHAHWHVMTTSEASDFPAVNALQQQLASHLLKMVKPDLEIYHHAAERLGVHPDEILFFDDLPENIEGARAAGFHAELIDPLLETQPQLLAHLRRAEVLT